MHVREEHPMDSMNGRIMDSRLMLLGSGLILDYDALSDGVDKEGMEMAICDSFKEIYLTLNTLTGKSASTIKKISKENFDNIFESWVAIMRKIIISEG